MPLSGKSEDYLALAIKNLESVEDSLRLEARIASEPEYHIAFAELATRVWSIRSSLSGLLNDTTPRFNKPDG